MIAVLMVAALLGLIVLATATTTLGSLKGGASERQAYQALLLSESGINTSFTRVAQLPIVRQPVDSNIASWLSGHPDLCAPAVSEGALSYQIRQNTVNADRWILTPAGTVGTARKVISVDMLGTRGPSRALRLPAALTAGPSTAT